MSSDYEKATIDQIKNLMRKLGKDDEVEKINTMLSSKDDEPIEEDD